MEYLKIWQEKILPSIVAAALIAFVGFIISAKVLAARVEYIESNHNKDVSILKEELKSKASTEKVDLIYDQVKLANEKLDEIIMSKKKADY